MFSEYSREILIAPSLSCNLDLIQLAITRHVFVCVVSSRRALWIAETLTNIAHFQLCSCHSRRCCLSKLGSSWVFLEFSSCWAMHVPQIYIQTQVNNVENYVYKSTVIYFRLTDPIVQLNVSNFNSTLPNQNHAWLIEFYSSWCGHCINFAPSFVHLAKKVEGMWSYFWLKPAIAESFTAGWRKTIQVGAVDCGDDVNLPICRHYDIRGYPTLKFFKPYANSSDLGIKYLGKKRPDVIQRNMVDFIMLLIDQNIAPNNWPSFIFPE